MIVSPAAGRQAFQLQVGIGVRKIAVPDLEMAGVLKYRQSRTDFIDRFANAPRVIQIRFDRETIGVFRIVRVESALAHRANARLAVARNDGDDIEKMPSAS